MFSAYDEWLFNEPYEDTYEAECLKTDDGSNIEADDAEKIYKWANHNFDEYSSCELAGEIDCYGEEIEEDDLISFLDIAGYFVPNEKCYVQDFLIDYLGTETLELSY